MTPYASSRFSGAYTSVLSSRSTSPASVRGRKYFVNDCGRMDGNLWFSYCRQRGSRQQQTWSARVSGAFGWMIGTDLWVHAVDRVLCRRPENLDDLDELVQARVTGKHGRPEQRLRDHARRRPHVDRRRVLGRSKDELGWRRENRESARRKVGRFREHSGESAALTSSVVPRADVRHVGLPGDELLCASKVDDLEQAGGRVNQNVGRLDVSICEPHTIPTSRSAKQSRRARQSCST